MDFWPERGGRLLIRPQPLRGESLRGYAMRLAEANGLLPTVDLYRTQVAPRGVASTRARLRKAATSLGLDSESLVALGCRDLASDATRCIFMGHRIASQHLRRSQAVVCPLCLTACCAIRADWELKPQLVCPDHAVWLVDQCPRCRRALQWRRCGVARCLCGHDLRTIKAKRAEPAVLDYGRAIASYLYDDPERGQSGLFGLDAKTSLNQVLGLYHLFTNVQFLDGVEPSLPHATRQLKGQAAIASAASQSMVDWPHQWHRLLDRIACEGLPAGDDRRRIVNAAEARRKFHAIERVKWSAASDFPAPLKSEHRKFMATRRVYVGTRRYYFIGDPARAANQPARDRLDHLCGTVHGAAWVRNRDLISAEVVRDLFDASPKQMKLLQRLGVAPSARAWTRAARIEEAFAKLTCRSHWYRPTRDAALKPLSDVRFDDEEALERVLRQVLSGAISTVTRQQLRPPGLRNLFVADDALIPSSLDKERGAAKDASFG